MLNPFLVWGLGLLLPPITGVVCGASTSAGRRLFTIAACGLLSWWAANVALMLLFASKGSEGGLLFFAFAYAATASWPVGLGVGAFARWLTNRISKRE